MNWLNSNMHSDDSDTDSSQSAADIGTIPKSNIKTAPNGLYLCAVCEKRTQNPIFNKDQSCLQCPNCLRSWCLQDLLHKKKCPKLDLIQKRYVEIKFSQSKHRKYDHHNTKHKLSWIGTNVLGNLGDVTDTFNQLTLAQNFEEPTLESLRAQQRFGIIHPNLEKYHPTHPAIIGSLPKLNTSDSKTYQILLKHNVCPICQLEFIDTGIESSEDEFDDLSSESDAQSNISTVMNEENIVSETKTNVFELMSSKKLNGNVCSITIENDMECKQPKQSIVSLYDKQSKINMPKNGINIGNELIASQTNGTSVEQKSNSIVNEWKPITEKKSETVNESENEIKIENPFVGDDKSENIKCEKDEICSDNIVRLWCGHLFHSDCVTPWLCKQNTCPLCRFELPSNNPSYELQKRAETYDSNSVYQVMT